ncbi:MAG TPA: N-methyl-L-tryptophan oxidase [Actinospica sp.]|nr:N-methyl-L-tryptophan oxidase [Actinospica sp.]HWG22495.1 N-methyl-L-tryptophan oxidase [Actinospica sp.]
MTEQLYDVIVLGLGGMGSAAAAHLAARGSRVLGIERFTPAHDRGASHGETRLIRQAYFEDPAYVPLLLRAYELWDELEHERPGILTVTGGLMIGRPAAAAVAGSLASARQWGLAHELLDAHDLRRRFPAFAVDDDTVALHEPLGGYVRPEETVLAHLDRAAKHGATLNFNEQVLDWQAHGDDGGVTVRTSKGGTYTAGSLVIAPGAWAPRLLPEFAPSLAVERQLLFWFAPSDGIERYRAPRFPVFIWEDAAGMQLYGFPSYGAAEDGVKIAFFRGGSRADPDDLDRRVHPHEVERMRDYLNTRIPGLSARYLRGLACTYTTTPDENFLLARHPGHPQVTVAAGFSGHGFKFVPVIGTIIADLVRDGATRLPIGLFAPGRL